MRGNAGQGHPLRVDNFYRPGGESVGCDVGGQAQFHDLTGGHRIHGVQHSGTQQLKVIEDSTAADLGSQRSFVAFCQAQFGDARHAQALGEWFGRGWIASTLGRVFPLVHER